MENKEMNTEKIKFYKKHPVLLAWLISIFIGLGYALFTIIASVIHYEQREIGRASCKERVCQYVKI